MRAHLNYKTPAAWTVDHDIYVVQNDDASFGYLANTDANGSYFFGGYNENVGATYSGTEGGKAVHSELTWSTHYDNINPICDFLNLCKNYIVNVEQQMSSDKYDTMVAGVRAYGNQEGYDAYLGSAVVFWGFGQTGLEINE